MAAAVLHETDKNAKVLYTYQTLVDVGPQSEAGWRGIAIQPVGVRGGLTRALARASSGVNPDSADFKGILAGVGALGSALAEIWIREAWGSWTLADPDILFPHNVVRHLARHDAIGKFKVEAVKQCLGATREPSEVQIDGVPEDVRSEKLHEHLASADFIVDVSTTLAVPRDLSRRSVPGRLASTFLTPSGLDSVLLLEPEDHAVRLDALEAQYYRAVINSDWGARHLIGHAGNLWVGAGCRDLSVVLSQELVSLHAATIARQLRRLRDSGDGQIRIWSLDDASGTLNAHTSRVAAAERLTRGGWEIVWDADTRAKLGDYRQKCLPSETGGVILGYIDHKAKAIYIVDVLPAPFDSEGDATGFVRGVDGLEKRVFDVAKRTANIVGYVGEWHSHPPFTPPAPSALDFTLIGKLAESLALDGHPAVMMIVGEGGEVTISLAELQ
ncbi:thiamine biosynthesis protein ThiF [compost metagenome]